jgi:hypothetical protein
MSEHKNTGGPAFPGPDDYMTDGTPLYGPKNIQGMDLRDYFAIRALDGVMRELEFQQIQCEFSDVAAKCYRFADALLDEREKGGGDE